MRKLALVLMGVLAFSAVAHAEVIVEWEQAPVVDPYTGESLIAYTMFLVAHDAGNVNTYYNTFAGTVIGPVVQQWYTLGNPPRQTVFRLATPADYPDFFPEEIAADTHLLVTPAGSIEAPYEDSNGVLHVGAFFIDPAARAARLAFLQIVAAPGAEVGFDGIVTQSNGTQEVLQITVPEPATMALLGLGALGLVARKRRAA